MNTLKTLDSVITETAMCLASSVDLRDWRQVQLASTFVPSGDTGSQQCRLIKGDGHQLVGWYPSNAHLDQLYELTKRHWHLTQDLGQPRWYKMTATVERTGKFNVDFEYKDDYKEGDIMKRG
jgi:Protein of unknown function, DUF600